MRSRLGTGLVLLLLCAPGCGDSLGPGITSLSVIEWLDEEHPMLITGPDSITVGETFGLRVRTYESPYCDESAGETVVAIGLLVQVRPFTHRRAGNCPDIGLVPNDREVTIGFGERGEARIVVWGWSSVVEDTIQIERRVVVH